ncbi:MAG TPA: hypothetical protein VMM38_10210 [Aridibacter sp.]|nr:hypothetical protein [Aridibacter sp.]
MKRFVTSIIFASVFFLGLGSIIEEAGAKFRSDDKALALVSAARQAVGGEDSLRGVRSMTIVGTTTNFFEKEGIPTTELGTAEINFELPGKYSKTIRIGDSSTVSGSGDVHKNVDVMVFEKSGDGADAVELPEGKGEVFIVRKGDGNAEWKSDEDVDFTKEGSKIIIRKNDGSVAELPADGKRRVVIEENEGGDASVWKTDDGKTVLFQSKGPHVAHRSSGGEMLRTTMGLLLSAPEGMDVSYKFIGEGNVDGYPANIIEVTSRSNSFTLYLDVSTSLPRMISYSGHNAFFFRKNANEEVVKSELIEMKRKMAEPVEHQIRFSDFRSVDGLVLPHRWTESVSGKQSRIFDVTSYEINPANIAEKFGDNKVFVRKAKPQRN